jgi:hypothetical protein
MVALRFTENLPIAAIATRLGLQERAVYLHLKAAGVRAPRAGRPKRR